MLLTVIAAISAAYLWRDASETTLAERAFESSQSHPIQRRVNIGEPRYVPETCRKIRDQVPELTPHEYDEKES
jgi:hypothetical protein